MDIRLDSKRAVVTAGVGGLGLVVANAFGRSGRHDLRM